MGVLEQVQAEGQKQSQILVAEGENESRILRADGEKQARIMEAEAEAAAILRVNEAMANSLKLLNESNPTDPVIRIKALEAFRGANVGVLPLPGLALSSSRLQIHQ